MQQFKLDLTMRVYFGENIALEALEKEKKIIGNRTLLITTGRSLERFGYVGELVNKLEELIGSGNVFIFNKVSANPDIEEVKEAVKVAKKEAVNSVIGFGGGSALDAAKAAAVGAVSEIDIENYLLEELDLPDETLPVIAVPTTAGTGAELSKGAIISSRGKGIKAGIRGGRITPAAAIVDPVYTWTVPVEITMETGFDVLAHAVESYLSVNANHFSEMLSEKAIRIVGENLRILLNNPDDHEARKEMCFASNIMGINLRNIGNCLPHRMQYPVGVSTETSHGAGLAALYPAWMKYEYQVNEDKINRVFLWLGCETVGSGGEAQKRMKEFLREIKILKNLTDLGNRLSEDKLSGMVTGNLENDKLFEVKGIVETIYKESM